jgi:NADH:ubiquinone oxidoreductase subunit 6 (subunit J)
MNNGPEPIPIGELLATESVKQVVANMKGYCACEKRVIELENLPRINVLEYRAQLLLEEEAELVEHLRHAPPQGSLRSRRVKATLYVALTALLVAAGCYFAFISLEPFRFGIKSLIYCTAVAVLTPFLVHCVLTRRDTEKLIRWAAAIACAAAITGVMLLAVIRGNIFMQEFETMNAAVVIDDAQPAAPQPETDFYKDTLGYLMAFMLLISLAMELGAGLALHEGSRMLAPDSEDWATMRQRLAIVRESLAEIIDEACTRQVAPELFAQKFHRDFYRAMLTQTVRSAITKAIVLLVCCLALFPAQANAETQPLNLVVAIDLTKSVDVSGPDGKTEFQKNIEAVGKVLAEIPPNTKLTIIGITDASFSQPYILLSATIPDDPGYFGERLRAARNQLVNAWKDRSERLEPKYTKTDVIGALTLAEQIFDQVAGEKVLVIFSDMRNNTAELDLESYSEITSGVSSPGHTSQAQVPLRRVVVLVLGADGSGRTRTYWLSLLDFWQNYFRSVGATLQGYSILRNLDSDVLKGVKNTR